MRGSGELFVHIPALHVHPNHTEATNIACIGVDSQTKPTSRHKFFGLQRYRSTTD